MAKRDRENRIRQGEVVSTSLTKEAILEKVPFLWFGFKIGVKVTE